MLERLALPTPLHELTERRQFRLGQRAFESEIKFDPLPLKNVRQQMLRVQARTLNRTLFEVSGGRLQHVKQSHGSRALGAWLLRALRMNARRSLCRCRRFFQSFLQI